MSCPRADPEPLVAGPLSVGVPSWLLVTEQEA
jgi:hypothetical protein